MFGDMNPRIQIGEKIYNLWSDGNFAPTDGFTAVAETVVPL